MWKSFVISALAALIVALVTIGFLIALTFSNVSEFNDFQNNCLQLNGVVIETTTGAACRYKTNEVIYYE